MDEQICSVQEGCPGAELDGWALLVHLRVGLAGRRNPMANVGLGPGVPQSSSGVDRYPLIREQHSLLPYPLAIRAMNIRLLPILGLLLVTASGLPAMAEQRGGPKTGGTRPQTPAELFNSDNPCGAQQRPCGW
jgi:hypothetical protein